jgi:hypothetical protein
MWAEFDLYHAEGDGENKIRDFIKISMINGQGQNTGRKLPQFAFTVPAEAYSRL